MEDESDIFLLSWKLHLGVTALIWVCEILREKFRVGVFLLSELWWGSLLLAAMPVFKAFVFFPLFFVWEKAYLSIPQYFDCAIRMKLSVIQTLQELLWVVALFHWSLMACEFFFLNKNQQPSQLTMPCTKIVGVNYLQLVANPTPSEWVCNGLIQKASNLRYLSWFLSWLGDVLESFSEIVLFLSHKSSDLRSYGELAVALIV